MVSTIRAARSVAFTRKSRLLCATALMSVLLPLASAQAQQVLRYTSTGTYDDDVILARSGTATITTAEDTVATWTGNLNFDSAGQVFVGDLYEDNGTIVFAPESVSGDSNGTRLVLRAGTMRLGSDAARDYFANQSTIAVLYQGVFDLFGRDEAAAFFLVDQGGRVTNTVAGTTSTLAIRGGFLWGGVEDGEGIVRIHKSGAGNLSVAAENTYSGGTEISGGTVELTHANGLGTGAIEFTADGSQAPELAIGNQLPMTVANDVILSGAAGAAIAVGEDTFATLAGTISGSGPLIKTNDGTLILTGQNTYTGDTVVQAGTLVVSGGDAIADTGDVDVRIGATLRVAQSETFDRLTVNNGANLEINTGATLTVGVFGGDSSINGIHTTGGGILHKLGAGTLTLSENNTRSGNTIVQGGRVSVGADWAFGIGRDVIFRRPAESHSVLELAADDLTIAQNLQLEDRIILDAAGSGVLAGVISGHNHTITKVGRGTVSLTGESLDAPGARVSEGGLSFDGNYSGDVDVEFGATVTGSGRIGGDVEIADGGRLYGQHDRTLTMGSLRLNENSDVEILVGAPGTTAFFEVEGDLTLDGRLTIADGTGDFGQGVYRLFNYGGDLTDNGMEVVGVPDGSQYGIGDIEIQTAIDKQVNVVVGGTPGPGPDPRPGTLFWDGHHTTADGEISGGYGVWRNGTTNWTTTNGDANHDWGGRFAVFQGEPGTVTVDGTDGDISVAGMQFAIDGYRVEGDPITMTEAETTIRVGDGSQMGADYVATIASELRGNGALVKDDLGTLILTGNNSYRGDTIVRNGTLVGNTQSIRNDIANNGHVVFDQADDGVFAGDIYGRGTMEKTGAGTLTLSGRSALDWTIDQGGLVSRTDLFGGNVRINDYSFMRFEQNGSGTYGGVISGFGTFQVAVGDGNFLRLTGDSSDFAGYTNVNSGGLMVDGSLGGNVSVYDGTVLAGSGTIGGHVVINSGATVTPGTGIGTLTIGGGITFREGSIYQVGVNGGGQSGLIDTASGADLHGGAVRVIAGAGNYAASTQYTILTAEGGVTGTFTEGVTSNLAFLDPSLSYDDNNVYLTMTRNGTTFENVGQTRNQIAAGGGVESLEAGNAVYDAVLNLSAEQARYAFDQLSGEIHASAKTALIEDSRFLRNAVNDRLRAAFDGVGASGSAVTYENGVPQPVSANTDGFAVWGQGFGSWGHTSGDGNAARLNRSTGGFFVGADAPVFDTWRFGAVAGYSQTSFNAKDRHSSGSSDNYHVGLYGGTAWGDLAFRSGAAYTWHDISTSRSVAFPGFSESLKGDYDAGTAQVFGELAYGFNFGATRFEPFANLAYVNLHTGGFRETGGAAALSSGSSSTDTTFTTLGLRGSTSFDLNGASVTAKGMVGWRHAFDDVTPTSTHRFVGGGNAFTVAGVPVARDAAVIEAGLDFALTPSAVIGVTYGGQFGSGIVDQSFKANFSAKF
ncbi:autotransporter domain-containing protein [Paradevosia shaoguanensis]|uniref:Autotransporter domain-containing protein n=1 Tax=Paradevosia shaoguanensis TaxID=1335043 RepID=A0AA41QN12_9HYPH|nr:autotransporter domain-containing protein [Paradevosia shaoguanensis]MCF1743052.1 autotransporter domain-containing protein [Paradevosia shaoguanensis]MCI0127535.1 autotransporter domain-containing protein [Paradevosia shaoguanensis]